jgi:hypothetical protein
MIATLLTVLATALAPQSLPSLSDEFSGATLSGWEVSQGDVQGGAATRFDVADGELTIHTGRSWWVNDSRAFFLHKRVDGDFKATVRVRATGEAGATPTADWSLTGLLVRAPTSDREDENWIGWTVGRVEGWNQFERKTTSHSASILHLVKAKPGWVQLRVVRIGAVFALLRRYAGKPWVLQWSYYRPELPRVLEVGVDAQSGYDSPRADLVSHVDYVRFAPTGVPEALTHGLYAGAPVRKLLPYLTR